MSAPRIERVAFHLGRISLASLFILGGINKLLDTDPSIRDMRAVGVPLPQVTIYAVVTVELGLGFIVAMGGWLRNGRLVSPAAVLLIAHTVLINILLHPFWSLDGSVAVVQLSLFFKNVSVMGGLAMVVALYWPPNLSLDQQYSH